MDFLGKIIVVLNYLRVSNIYFILFLFEFFFSGMATGVLGMFLAEIAPSELRGSIAIFHSLGK